MVCSIIQTYAQFHSRGCPNCDHVLELVGNQDAIAESTSSVFEGVIMMADPQGSWVAKWQRLEGYVPGMYAVKVSGTVSGWV
jgi:transcription elongation factor SPT4